MKTFKQSKVYKLIRRSGFTVKEVIKHTQFYTSEQIHALAKQEKEPVSLLEEIEKAIKTINNNLNSPVGHLDVKFRIGQTVYYPDLMKNKLFVRETRILGFGIITGSQTHDVLYLCDLFDLSNNRKFYDDEIFSTVDAALSYIKHAKVHLDVLK